MLENIVLLTVFLITYWFVESMKNALSEISKWVSRTGNSISMAIWNALKIDMSTIMSKIGFQATKSKISDMNSKIKNINMMK